MRLSHREAKRRAERNLLRRIGPSTMPIETTILESGQVKAFDPETGSSVTFDIRRYRLVNANYRLPEYLR